MNLIDDLKEAEEKHRAKYKAGNITEGIIADAFKLAISKLDIKGYEVTFAFFKEKREKPYDEFSTLGRKLNHAYNQVYEKLWKHRKEEIKCK